MSKRTSLAQTASQQGSVNSVADGFEPARIID
jgi:hypothetical protein